MEHIQRLKKLKEKENNKIVKLASSEIYLDSIGLNSGDSIDFFVRSVNNKPWYTIKHEHPWESSTFYDGPDFNRACNVYKDILMSFGSITMAENFIKAIPTYVNKINKYYEIPERNKFQEYHNLIQKSPKFLGFNDF